MTHTELSPLDPMLTMEQVRQLIPLSHSQIRRLMARHEFPQSIKIGRSRVAWHRKDIADWIATRPRGVSAASR